MTTFTESISLTSIDCGECGGTYAINERYRKEKEQVGASWNCPYCKCGWGYSNNGENSRLKKQLEQTQNELRSSKCETLSERLAREAAEKKLRRARNGVCPDCNRSFTNLKRHIETKHKNPTTKVCQH